MLFKKLEILEFKNDINVYYGMINNNSSILYAWKNIPNELNIDGEILIKNENFYKIKINDSTISVYYPASEEMIEAYKNKTKIIKESYDDYINKVEPYIDSILESNTKWIKNILYNENENNRILLKTDKFIIIKNICWDNNNDFYILAIPFESFKNIRHLDTSHKDLLLSMKMKTLEISKLYNFDEQDLYFFFHYHPSCYHLHLHVCLNTHKKLKCKIYRHVMLEYLLENLENIGKKEMKFEINISNPIYKLLQEEKT